MIVRPGLLALVCCILVACSSTGGPGTGGLPPADGGASAGDGGSAGVDGGILDADGGLAAADGGNGSADGGGVTDGGGDSADGGTGPGVTPGCAAGTVRGRVCAPSGVLWLADAAVTVVAQDCAGQTVRVETTTDLDGFYTLEGVPAGAVELHIRKGSFTTTADVSVPDGGTLDLTGRDQKVCFSRSSARIAVLGGAFDSVETVLDQLGLEYTWYDGIDAPVPTGLELLLDPQELNQYDIVLINCGINYWSTLNNNPLGWARIVTNIQDFVRAGGSLYISDWAFKLVEDPFPTFVNFHGIDSEASNVNAGYAPQTIEADVLDPALANLLGAPTTEIIFPNSYPAISNNWSMMTDVGTETRVLVRGDAHRCEVIASCYDPGPIIPKAPLLVSFRPYETGKVIFTSFHLETVSSDTVVSLLRYLIFLL